MSIFWQKAINMLRLRWTYFSTQFLFPPVSFLGWFIYWVFCPCYKYNFVLILPSFPVFETFVNWTPAWVDCSRMKQHYSRRDIVDVFIFHAYGHFFLLAKFIKIIPQILSTIAASLPHTLAAKNATHPKRVYYRLTEKYWTTVKYSKCKRAHRKD